ncbi:polysaccharide pyruvyl transferase family protein [Tropicibacter sp. R16_0]|uniref:polysaccharide pyruvyl transferase family protein n=1 Tax=Tropicibacter sp. R16_0 TaxID=2821102 RepID=UPI001ADABFF4|nr:polysaccharide pyruvyl transferase family protein [Tropicibacter sp. R16_0]MBO9453337.1 polysaccharide pyruvyl transferase family protein [Tropicibacter sp. R16_0]
MKKKVALIGYFGWGNFGDELFVSTHRQWLGETYDLFVANDLLRAPYFSFPVEDLVDKADAFLIGGGDLLNPVHASTLYWKMEYLKKPVFIHGLGVDERSFKRAKVLRHYKAFMQHPNCKLIVARDIESQAWIKEHIDPGDDKLMCYPDPVCAFARPAPTPPKEKTLGVVMREHRSLKPDMAPVKDLIATAKGMGYRVKHLVLANKSLGKGDLKRARMIAEEGDEIFYSDSLEDMCQAISSCSILATIKLHGMIVATMYGVPSIAMTDSPKNRNFLRLIDREEMQADYSDPGLKTHLAHHPARIHHLIRNSLHRRAVAGYDVVKQAMAAVL